MKPSLHIQRILRPVFLSLVTTILATSFTVDAAVEQAVSAVAEEKNLAKDPTLQGTDQDLTILEEYNNATSYFVGAGITGINTNTTPAEGTLTLGNVTGSINVKSTGGPNAGAIGTAVTQAIITNFTASITSEGGGEARGLGMSNLNYFNQGVADAAMMGSAGYIQTLLSTIKVTQTSVSTEENRVDGESYGIHLEYNSGIKLVDAGTDIDVTSVSGSAAGIFLQYGGHIETIGATSPEAFAPESSIAPVTIDVTSNDNYAIGISIDNAAPPLEFAVEPTRIGTIGKATMNIHSNSGRATGISLSTEGATIDTIIGTTINVTTAGILPPMVEGVESDRTIYDAAGIDLKGAGTLISLIDGAKITAQTENGSTYGIRLTGNGGPSLDPGLGATVKSIVNTNIKVHSESGNAMGIELGNGTTVSNISNTTITVSADGLQAAGATGIRVGTGAFLGTIENVTVNISTTGTSAVNGMIFEAGALPYGASLTGYSAKNVTVNAVGTSGAVGFVTGNITEDFMNYTPTSVPGMDNIGAISGTFSMISNEMIPGGMSVGYTLAKLKTSTEFSLGFQNTNTTAPTDEGVSYEDTSFGYLVDWSNTTMAVQRNYGFTAGSIIVGSDRVTAMGLQGTVLGKDNIISATTVNNGSTAAAFLQGIDLSEGQLWGTLYAYSGSGIVGGLGTVGTSLNGGAFIPQTDESSIMNNIGGNITAELGQEDTSSRPSIAIGAQFGDVNVAYSQDPDTGAKLYADYQTKLVGNFSGTITAKINDLRLNSGTPYSSTIVAAVITHGETNNGVSEVLRFDTDAHAEHDDAAGVTFNALIYDIDNTTSVKSLVGLGQAITSVAGDINLSTRTAEGVKTHGLVSLNGNIVAGMTGSESLKFQEGNYNVTSNDWLASEGITVGLINDIDALHGIATVRLDNFVSFTGEFVDNSIEIKTSTLNFTGNSATDVSKIYVGANQTLEFTDLANVNIYLKQDAEYYEDYFANGGDAIFFVDSGASQYFDTDKTGITYTLYINGAKVDLSGYSYKIYHDQYGIYINDEIAPEPSTATLSLLALAGLLARRRRKVQG